MSAAISQPDHVESGEHRDPAASSEPGEHPQLADPDGRPVASVVVRRSAGLAALLGAAASAVAIAYLWRASQSAAPLDWSLGAVTAVIAVAYLASLVDARTPLLVADDLGVRIRLGHQWRGLPWDAVRTVAVQPRRGPLREGALMFAPHSLGRALDGLDGRGRRAAAKNQKAYGAALAVPLGLTTRASARGDELVERLGLLAGGRAEVSVVPARPDREPDAGPDAEAFPDERDPDAPVTGSDVASAATETDPGPPAGQDAGRGRHDATGEVWNDIGPDRAEPWSEHRPDHPAGNALADRQDQDEAAGTERADVRKRGTRGLLDGLGAAVSRLGRVHRPDPGWAADDEPDAWDEHPGELLLAYRDPPPGAHVGARSDDLSGDLSDGPSGHVADKRPGRAGDGRRDEPDAVHHEGSTEDPTGVDHDGRRDERPRGKAAGEAAGERSDDPAVPARGPESRRGTTLALLGGRRGLRGRAGRGGEPAVLGSTALLPDSADHAGRTAHDRLDDGSVRRLPEEEELRRAPQPFDDGRVRPLSRLGEPVEPLVVEDFVTEPAYDPVIGPELAAARTRVGLSVDELAERTRIRPHVIESIEVDDFAPCGGDFYARGHLRTLARVLGRDAGPLLEQFDLRYATAPVTARTVFEAELATGMTGSMRTTAGGVASWPLLIGVVLVLVLIWGVVRLFASEPPETLQSPVPVLHGSHGAARAHSGSGSPLGPASVAVGAPVRVRLTAARAASRVVVRDETGKVVWAGNLATGEAHTLRATPPVRVRAKDAGAVEVSVAGRAEGTVGSLGQPGRRTFHRPAR